MTKNELSAFIDRVHAFLAGHRQGLSISELMRRMATQSEPAESIYYRLQVWSRADCRDSHGIGFYQSRPRAPLFVYLLSEPFHPPHSEPCVSRREKRKQHACP